MKTVDVVEYVSFYNDGTYDYWKIVEGKVQQFYPRTNMPFIRLDPTVKWAAHCYKVPVQ